MKLPCSQCNEQKSTESMLQIDGSWICAICKPLYVQALREGKAPASRSVWSSLFLALFSLLQFAGFALAFLQCDQDDLANPSEWVVFSIYLAMAGITLLAVLFHKALLLKGLVCAATLQLMWGVWVLWSTGKVWFSFAKRMSSTLELVVMISVYLIFLTVLPILTLLFSIPWCKRLIKKRRTKQPSP